MRKIVSLLTLMIFIASLSYADLHSMLKSMGYRDSYIFENAPDVISDFPTRRPLRIREDVSEPILEPEAFLKTRIFDPADSTAMLPTLMRMHEENPLCGDITRRISNLYLHSGKYEEALHWFIGTYQRDRADLVSLWNMAALSYQLDRPAQTKKILSEYSKVDPNSAWGRMAREFLRGRFSGSELSDGFSDTSPRIGRAEASAKPSSGHIMILEDTRTNFDHFMKNY